MGKAEGKRSLGIPRRRWEDKIEMDLQDVLLGGMDWIDLARIMDSWRELLNAIMILWVP